MNHNQLKAKNIDDQDAEKIKESKIAASKALIAEQYEKGEAYTKGIIAAGYVAFFTVWGNTKQYLSREDVLFSALLITLSLVFFIIWEIYKMIRLSQLFHETLSAYNKALPTEIDECIEIRKKAKVEFNIQMRQHVRLIWILTIVPGLWAGGILLTSFIQRLFLFEP